MTASRLVLRSVVRRYAGMARPAVDGVSLDVRAGELLAIVGASGAGKSTVLRVVAGYERPDHGTVLLDERDVTTLPPERRGFGMVFQHHALFPHLTVEDNVAFGLEARGVPRGERAERTRRALAGVGLEGTGRRDVQSLSGGEQQRVALARALVVEPRVLLLDEPFSSLDPALRVTLRDELRALLHRTPVTALFVTHEQDDAFAIADRVALLHDGRLLQVGRPEALYDRPASRAVAEFIGGAVVVRAELEDDEAAMTIGGVTQYAPAVVPTDLGGGWLAVLRRESLVLDDPSSPVVWPGEVTARRFAGAATICHVRLAGGLVVEVSTTDRHVRERDRVGIRVVGERVSLVADESDPDRRAIIRR